MQVPAVKIGTVKEIEWIGEIHKDEDGLGQEGVLVLENSLLSSILCSKTYYGW
jgi:hypothetical protein